MTTEKAEPKVEVRDADTLIVNCPCGGVHEIKFDSEGNFTNTWTEPEPAAPPKEKHFADTIADSFKRKGGK